MKNVLETVKKNAIVTAVIFIVVGLCLILWPKESQNIVGYVLGGLLILIGLWRTVDYFREANKEEVAFSWSLTGGVLLALLGFIILTKMELFMGILTVFLGLALLAGGLSDVQRAMHYKRNGISFWKWVLVLAVLSIAAGIIIMFNPFSSKDVLWIMIGASFLYEGVMNLVTVTVISGKVKKVEKAIENHP